MSKVVSVFISDVHLGSRHAQSKKLLNFLTQIHEKSDPEKIYLIGDFIDGWKLKRSWYWNNDATMVIRKLFSCIRDGTEVIYVAGNHDEFLRSLFKDSTPTEFGAVKIVDETTHITQDGRRMLLMHGDKFDLITKHAKWLVLAGVVGYDILLWLNTTMNKIRKWLKLPYWSLSKLVKRRVKQAVNYLSDFERFLADYAEQKGFDGVICGHIHHPEHRQIQNVEYYNTGDWVENCTAIVEWDDGRLEIIYFDKIYELKM